MTATRSLAQLMNLSGRHALVTGGAGNIGLAVGEALVELGATVAVADLDPAACQARAECLCAQGRGAAWPLPFDLRDEEATRASVHRAVDRHGGLDILVHCAGYVGGPNEAGYSVPFAQQTVAGWDAAHRINLTSAFVLIQEANPALARTGRGSVILFGSIYGVCGPDLRLYEGTAMANEAGYAVSKGGLLQLTRYLATLLAPAIRVNAISPGGVWRGQPEVFVRRYVDRTPLGRMATEEDLKGAVAYLAGDLSAYVTGHNLAVDGGWTSW